MEFDDVFSCARNYIKESLQLLSEFQSPTTLALRRERVRRLLRESESAQYYKDINLGKELEKSICDVDNFIQEYKNYLIEYLENLMENRSISVVKNYAIISYDGTYENAIEELNRKSMSFKGNLLRAKIVCEILNEDEIKNLIYRELNKNSSQNISKLQEGGKNLYVGKKQKAKRN